MTHEHFCKCEHPLVDVDGYSCRRCGLDVTLFRLSTEGLAAETPLHSIRAELVELARRQEFVDRLCPPLDEAGFVRPELLAAIVGMALLAGTLAFLLWHYIVGAGVLLLAVRHLRRHGRRRRPRSSWSSLGRTAAMLYASWNSRGLVRRNGRPLRVSVPARAGREHVDEYGEIPF